MGNVTKEYLIKQLHRFEELVLDRKYATPYTAGNGIDITNGVISTDLGTAAGKNFTTYVAPGVTDIPIGASVYAAITSAARGVLHPAGSKTCAQLTSDLLVQANVGNVYKVTDSGVTTELFVGGAGHTIHENDDVIVVYGGSEGVFKFDLQNGVVDMTDYQKKELDQPITVGGTEETTVEGALEAINTDKVEKVTGKGLSTNDYDNTEKQKVANAIQKSQTAGLVKNDGTVDTTSYAKQSEMSVTNGTGADADKTTIQLKTGTSAIVLKAHQDISGYQKKDLATAVEGATTVEGALGALSTNKATQAEVNDIVNVLGAKNLLPYPYDTSTVTKNNVSFTDNGDGTVTISTLGSRSSNTFFNLSTRENFGASNWSLSGSSEKEKTIGNFIASNGLDNFVSGLDFGYTASNMQTWILVNPSAELNNVTIKPMIRLASDPDDTYVPYAMTNQQITPYVQAISNRNLLDNPWFTINQRNLTTYSTPSSGKRFTVDRWAENNHATVVKNANGVTITSDSSGDNGDLGQTVDGLYSYLVGKLVTASVMLQNGKIYSKSGVLNANLVGTIRFDLENGFRCDVNTNSSRSYLGFYIYSGTNNADASIAVRAVKLELGGVSTLASDTMPNEAQELAKCMRYFERNNWHDWGCIRCRNAGELNYGMTYPFLVKKRGVPKFTFNVAGSVGIGNGYIYDMTDGTSIPISEVTLQQPGAYNYRMIQVKMRHSSFVVGHDYCVAVGDNVIDISADI